MAKRIDVTVRVNGTAIECDTQGGNAHLKLKDQMRWHIDDVTTPFMLTFTNFDTGAPATPFGTATIGPTADTNWLTVSNADSQYCKYTVSIQQCHPLDPIIIVDKNRNTIPTGKKSSRRAGGRKAARKR